MFIWIRGPRTAAFPDNPDINNHPELPRLCGSFVPGVFRGEDGKRRDLQRVHTGPTGGPDWARLEFYSRLSECDGTTGRFKASA